jgi:hypothetical protein
MIALKKKKEKKWLVAVVKLSCTMALFYNREGKVERSPIFLLPPWSSHCPGARLPLGDYSLSRAYDCRNKTVRK